MSGKPWHGVRAPWERTPHLGPLDRQAAVRDAIAEGRVHPHEEVLALREEIDELRAELEALRGPIPPPGRIDLTIWPKTGEIEAHTHVDKHGDTDPETVEISRAPIAGDGGPSNG